MNLSRFQDIYSTLYFVLAVIGFKNSPHMSYNKLSTPFVSSTSMNSLLTPSNNVQSEPGASHRLVRYILYVHGTFKYQKTMNCTQHKTELTIVSKKLFS